MEKIINWEQVSKDRRAKILWMPRRMVLDALIVSTQDATRIIRFALPKLYHISDVHYDFTRDSFGFIILSPEFPMNLIGAELPGIPQGEIKKVAVDLQKP